MDRPSRRRRLFRWILAASIALVTLVAVEIGLRIVLPPLAPLPEWGWNPALGCVQMPGTVYEEGGLRIEHNRLGFRDVDHTVEKPPGTFRIVVIGDSFTESEGVNLEDTYWKRLEAALNERSGPRVEVISLGVSDFGTYQEAITLERYGLAYQPNLVIHQIFALNDIANNSFEYAGLNATMNDPYRPYVVERDGHLVPVYLQPVRQTLRNLLVSFRFLEYLGNVAAYGTNDIYAMLTAYDEALNERIRAAGMPLRAELDTYVEEDRQMPRTRRAWRVTEMLCQRIVGTCRRHGVGLAVVAMPFESFVGHFKEVFAQQDPPLLAGSAEARLARLYARLGVPFLDMWKIFDEDEESFHPALGGHLNVKAHGVVAEHLLELLDRNELLW